MKARNCPCRGVSLAATQSSPFDPISFGVQRKKKFLMRQFSRIGDCFFFVYVFQRRIASENLFPARSLGKAVEDVRNKDACSLGAELAVTNQRVTAEVLPPVNHDPASFLSGPLGVAWPLLNVFDPQQARRKWAPVEADIQTPVRGDNLTVPTYGQGQIQTVVDASAKPRCDVQSGVNETKGRNRVDWETPEVL